MTLAVLFLVVALVLFVSAAVGFPPAGRYSAGWAGAAFATLALLMPYLK